MQVLRSPRAEQDLIEIWNAIAADSRRAADRTLDRIGAACALLAERPGLGTAREDLAPGLRSWVVRPYLLYYRVRRDWLELVRALHGARDVPPRP